MFKGILGKYIFRYYMEVLLAIAFIIISYFGMSNSTLSSYANLIDDMANAEFGLDVSVEAVYSKKKNVYSENIISIHNPKKRKANCDVILVIESDDMNVINDLVVLADDEAIDSKQMIKDVNTYRVSLGKSEILSNENTKRNVKILGKLKSQSVKYYFNVIEGF